MRSKIVPLIAAAIPVEQWRCNTDRALSLRYNMSHTSVNRARKLTGIPGPGTRVTDYNFAGVDWRKGNLEIARQIGCSRHAVIMERKRQGITSLETMGRKGQSKWLGVDWSLDNSTLAQMHETTKENVGRARRRVASIRAAQKA